MRLIIKEYLSSLNEREELDALLPDLLSQMGLNVISRPGRGTRQYGVDIAAVGNIDDKPEKVYLLSVKAGDLGREDWNSGSLQDLRPSLDEIIDVYIPTHLPSEHRDKPIEICICIGGDIKESVRLNISQYEKSKKTDALAIVEWDGDRLSSMVEKYFLQEDLLPEGLRPQLRKSLALLDEPQSSFSHFQELISSLSNSKISSNSNRITILRQMNICLWIMFAWARGIGNLESAYLSSEITLLHAWELSKKLFDKKSKAAKSVQMTFSSILNVYQQISVDFISKNITPYSGKFHGLSSAVHSSEKIDINLKLFNVMGRLSIAGIWLRYSYDINHDDKEMQELYASHVTAVADVLKNMIINNPTLFTPIMDEQVIDISLALLFLSMCDGNEKFSIDWLSETLNRVVFAFDTNGKYPGVYRDYRELLDHPKDNGDDYKKDATSASILHPVVGLWAAILKDEGLYKAVQSAREMKFPHCNYQIWYLDESSEDNLYLNSATHGAAFSNVPINQPPDEFLSSVWGECDDSDSFKSLSCVKYGIWPLVLIACRHYRLPVPVDFTLNYRDKKLESAKKVTYFGENGYSLENNK